MVQKIIDFFKQIMGLILTLLPNSPFTKFIDAMSGNTLLGYASYFLPIPQIIALSEAWLTCITVFYVCQVLLRWVKAIE